MPAAYSPHETTREKTTIENWEMFLAA